MTKEKVIEKTGWNLDNSYTRLPKSFFKIIKPNPVPSPKLIILNYSLVKALGLSVDGLKCEDGLEILAGNKTPEGSIPIAQAYAGNQFGHFTMLGDGRALLIGEQINNLGERFDIQLKGSGRTPYSRGGDGRAGLGPMLREYIISEAMHALGIPTTRSLSVVTTGEEIIRDSYQKGAIMTRVASSHIRVGTFQYISEWGTTEELKALVDYTLQRHFPGAENSKNKYLFLLQEVIKRQALLISKWQLVGFIHGVMNTDNMSICGESIDFGPCAFMNNYDPSTVFSSIDTHGRYAYGNQPNIAAWNLTRFAETLLPLIHENEEDAIKLAKNEILNFTILYDVNWLAGMRSKLGLFNEDVQDESLIKELLSIMKKYKADYTNTFLALTFDKQDDSELFNSEEFTRWKELWKARRESQKETKDSSHELMKKSNPALIPRNHRVEEALDAAVAKEDYNVMERLLDALSNPFAHSDAQAEYSKPSSQSETSYRTYCGT